MHCKIGFLLGKNKIIIIIIQRLHKLYFFKDIAFIDNASSCDPQSHSVTFM